MSDQLGDSPGPTGIDHVAIVVVDLAASVDLYARQLGGEVVAGGDEIDLAVRSVHIKYPDGGKLEILCPIGPGPIRDFLESRGEGLHHITFTNPGLERLATQIRDAGYSVAAEDYESKAWGEAFIPPRAAFGCVVQIVDRMDQYGFRVDGLKVEDVLAGRWQWRDGVPVEVNGRTER